MKALGNRRSNVLRKDNTHRLLFYLQKRTSQKHAEFRGLLLKLFFELYELRRDNSGIFIWVRAVDGVSVYLGERRVLDFQIAQKHLLLNASEESHLLPIGDKMFGRNNRHQGSGYRQWKISTSDEIEALIKFLNKLPKAKANGMKVSRAIPQWVRELVLERDGGKCRVCGVSSNIHFDHQIPFSKGGGNDPKNIRVLCAKHNLEQSASMKY